MDEIILYHWFLCITRERSIINNCTVEPMIAVKYLNFFHVGIEQLEKINRNELPVSSTVFLFVNNSSHPRGKGDYCMETKEDDYVGCYGNTRSLYLIALVRLCRGFTNCCAQSRTINSAVHDSQLCSNFPNNLYQVFLVAGAVSA